jgi:transposase
MSLADPLSLPVGASADEPIPFTDLAFQWRAIEAKALSDIRRIFEDGAFCLGPFGKGMKIMAIVDRHGLPLSVSTHPANHHGSAFGAAMFRLLHDRSQPENLIGDRAYDSDPLDAELRRDGIEMIAPHRCNRSKPPTRDRRRLSRYMRRWLVERFFAWLQWQRRILLRWEYHAHNFLGFVQLACLIILFKRF